MGSYFIFPQLVGSSHPTSFLVKRVNTLFLNHLVGSASATDAHKLDFDEHGDFKVGNFTDYNDMKTEDGKEALIAEPPSCESHPEAHVDNHDLEHRLSVKGPIEVFCEGAFDCSLPETQVKVENVDQHACIKNGIPPRVGASETSLMENGVAKVSMKEEVCFHLLYFISLLHSCLILLVIDDMFVILC